MRVIIKLLLLLVCFRSQLVQNVNHRPNVPDMLLKRNKYDQASVVPEAHHLEVTKFSCYVRNNTGFF